MTAASSLPYPSSRTLAGWWKQLSALQPEALWVGHLLVHRIEAAVEVHEARPLPQLTQILLQALKVVSPQGEAPLPALESILGLPPVLLRPLLRDLSGNCLLDAPAPDQWRLTPAGHAALEKGHSSSCLRRRQVFPFAERRDAAGARSASPLFLPLDHTPLARAGMTESFPFEPGWLDACVNQDASWKQDHGFPQDVHRLLRVEEVPEEDYPAWKRVLIDRLEEITLTVARTREGVQGFAVAPTDWSLDLSHGLVRTPCRCEEVLPVEDSAATWRQVWLAWAKLRNLPTQEADACRLSLEGCVLRVDGSQRLFDALRQIKSDLLKGEAWVLLGEGFVRRAARLEFTVG